MNPSTGQSERVSAQATVHAAPTPERIFQTMNAFQQTAALKGAIELDLFTAIAEGNTDTESIAKRCGASTRGTRILCDYLTVGGFLTKTDEHYGLAPDSAIFLNRKSPAYIGEAIVFLNHRRVMEAHQDVAAAVRKGGTVLPGSGSMEENFPAWVDFAKGMAPLMRPAAQYIAELVDSGRPLRVLDIAASHGVFGIAVAARNPGSEVVAVDWAPVLEVALENAHAAGLNGRYRTLPGSAFEVPFGSDFDVALVTNFMHHFDLETNQRLLEKIHASLKPGGVLVALEFVPEEDRISPPIPARFSMVMLGSTPSGDAYTFSQYERIFTAAGFRNAGLLQPINTPEQVLIAYK
jgi:SAM-dependent methyltransferase